MSQTHTIVVHFPEGIVPRYSAATQFQGGDVVAVNFAGNRMDIADELEEALDTLIHAAEHEYGVTASTLSEAKDALAKARGES